jgi:transposase
MGKRKAGKPGRPVSIQGEHLEALRCMVEQMPNATMEELCGEFHRRTGVKVCTLTLYRTLQRAGLQRRVPPLDPAPASAVAPRYGYSQAHRREGESDKYASSLTDAEWALAEDLFELPAGHRGRPPKYERRAMVDACCYVLRTGCAWAMLPKSFPPWRTVHKSFSRWTAQGKFEQLHQRLREQWRQRIERNAQPTAAILDSQSTRISTQGGESGFDAGKKVKGRKRHLVVDTLGLLLAVTITAASVQDRDAAPAVVASACQKYQTLETVFADSAYAGQCATSLERDLAVKVDIVRRPHPNGQWSDPQMSLWPARGGFAVLPKRWVVERTHAWNERCRRLTMHHDRSSKIAESWIWLAQAGILLRRLA